MPYSGIVELSGSKSILQRYLFIASLQPMKLKLTPGSICDDVKEMAEALRSLGIRISVSNKAIAADSAASDLFRDVTVKFRASATALRFWLARSAVSRGRTTILISEELYKRPLHPFLNSLKTLGCQIEIKTSDEPEFPYRIRISSPSSLPSKCEIDANISSQFISGLMMIAPLTPHGLRLKLRQEAVSRHYLELTKNIMASLQVSAGMAQRSIAVPGNCVYLIKDDVIKAEPELSGGAFFLALAAFSKAGIGIQTTPPPRLQPDWEIINIVKNMGAVVLRNDTEIAVKSGTLHGIEHDMEHFPDLVPLTAALALFAESPSLLRNISRLRYKESDRIKGILTALNQLSAGYDFDGTNLRVLPLSKSVKAATLNTQNDHRLVIAFTLLKLIYPQLELSETASVNKSCPEFFTQLAALRNKD